MPSTKPTAQLTHTHQRGRRASALRVSTHQRHFLRTSAALAALALALGACGGSGDSAAPSATSTVVSPTKEEVKAGFIAILDDGLSQLDQEITDEVRENYTQCLVDEAYDDLSPAGREAIANLSDDAAISNPDRVTISKASTACRKHVGELIIPGS